MACVSRFVSATKLFSIRNVAVIQTRNSQWAKVYVKSKESREEIEELKQSKEEFEQIKFAPVRAAINSASTSLFRSHTYEKFLKVFMRDGDKELAIKLMSMALFEVKKMQLEKYRNAKTDEERESIELDPMIIFEQAIENCKPMLITRKIKRGGATYQVPYPLTPKSATFLAMKWLSDTIRWRPKPRLEPFQVAMAKELLAAYSQEGKVYKKKQDLHKLCEANKAYAHYRWS